MEASDNRRGPSLEDNRYVALLRGINVGGNRKVDMRSLQTVFVCAGMSAVTTYINSGNVIFDSELSDISGLRTVLQRAIESEFGFPVSVLIRTAAQMADVATQLPEAWVDRGDKCDVIFLGEQVDSAAVLEQLVVRPGVDDVKYVPGAVIWHVERAKLTRSGITRLVGTPLYAQTTIRNCNTVRKLARLVER